MAFHESADIIYGRWPVREALSNNGVLKLFIAQGSKGHPIDEIIALAREKKVAFHWMDRQRLDQMAGGGRHQGVVAQAAPVAFADFDNLLDKAINQAAAGPALLFLDGILDPQNLGSILRTAVFFGVSGVVIPKWRSASLTGTVMRTSAGAARLIPVAQVSNLSNALEKARKKDLWLIGADMKGDAVGTKDVPRPFGLVLGSEGEGLHQLIRTKCDMLLSIPGAPRRQGIDSLNVGVACGILLQRFCTP